VDFRALETFLWIARLGSFRAAAKRLYTSQPSVSWRMANLEQQLGVQLFERTGRHVTLTARGRDMLGFAERLLTLQGEMIEAVADAHAMQGSIRLGVVETVVYTWLPRLIERVNEAYPLISLELDVDTSVNLADKLVGHDIDIALLVGPVSQPGFTNEVLCHYPLEWVASPRLVLPPEPVPFAKLTQWPVITYPRHSQPHSEILDLLARSDSRVRIHSSSSLATIIRMTVDGIGVSALPPEIIRRELGNNTLRIFKAQMPLRGLDLTVSYTKTPESSFSRAVAKLAMQVVTAATDNQT
jgi:DNA-binding transcriptional LysR family regulator